MSLYDKVYRMISKFNFLLHIGVFLLVLVASVFPYCDNKNFYQHYFGAFGNWLKFAHPIIMIFLLLLACFFSFLAIKRPLFSICILIFNLVFYFWIIMPISAQALVLSIKAYFGQDVQFPNYQIGFNLISYTTPIILCDVIFLPCAVTTSIVWRIRRLRMAKKAATEDDTDKIQEVDI